MCSIHVLSTDLGDPIVLARHSRDWLFLQNVARAQILIMIIILIPSYTVSHCYDILKPVCAFYWEVVISRISFRGGGGHLPPLDICLPPLKYL